MQKGISLPGEMVLQLTQLQDDLYRHICVLCADVERAKDILQETNLEICAKYPTFDETKGTFKAWCKTLATYQVRRPCSTPNATRGVWSSTKMSSTCWSTRSPKSQMPTLDDAFPACNGVYRAARPS